jgi:hypothetical protein
VIYTVTAYVNVAEDHHFCELQAGQPVAEVGRFAVEADTPQRAADVMWPIGNKMKPDDSEARLFWPRDVRSLSVGDLLKVVDPGGDEHFLAVAPTGWTDLPEPANPVVELAGTRATSRT